MTSNMDDPPKNRHGHAAIAAIISNMENYLPPPNNSKPGYSGCRTTYGLLSRFHQRAEQSDNPEKEYKELQQIERDLRRRITNLDAKKGVHKVSPLISSSKPFRHSWMGSQRPLPSPRRTGRWSVIEDSQRSGMSCKMRRSGLISSMPSAIDCSSGSSTWKLDGDRGILPMMKTMHLSRS